MNFKAVRLSLCCACLCVFHIAFADTPPIIDLPAGDLKTALDTLSKQSGIDLVYRPEQVKGLKTHGVHGAHSVSEAVSKLLEGTGLEVSTDATGAMLIAAPPVKPRAAATSTNDSAANKDAGSKTSQDFRVAQADHAAAGPSAVEKQGELDSKAKNEGLEEIVVTGSHMRGVGQTATETIVYDREAIQRSGYTTTQQLLASLPQNFTGGDLGASESGAVGPGSLALINISASSGVNLRGLGTNSTLTLINGHRIAQSGFGQVADVSLIPLSAIERIEIVPDGSSAIYGSDAVGGVVNFILRKDYEGAETKVNYVHSTQGSPNEREVDQLVGHSWGTGSALLNVTYMNRDSLSSTDRSFTDSAPQPTDLLPQTQQTGVVANVHQEITETTQLFADALFSHKDVSRDFTGTYQGENSYAAPTDLNLDIGFIAKGFKDWQLVTTGLYGVEDADQYLWNSPLIPGYANGQLYEHNFYRDFSAETVADGTLFRAFGGDAHAAFGFSYRKEDFDSTVPSSAAVRMVNRRVTAEFGELYIPLVSDEEPRLFISKLSVTAAIRHDEYSDFGGTTNPKIGILLTPIKPLTLKGSYSTSFRAPNPYELVQIAGGQQLINYPFSAPGGGTVPVFISEGSNPTLSPEKSRTWTAGIEYRPLPDFVASIDYYNINYRNRIITPPFSTSALLQPNLYGSLITPFANDAAAQGYLQSAIAQGAQFFDYLGTGAAGVRAVVNLEQQNAALVNISGLDLQLNYVYKFDSNELDLHFNGSYIDNIDTALTSTAASQNLVNTYGNPLRYRARFDTSWQRGDVRINFASNFSGAYTNTSFVPITSVSSWTTFDVNLQYSPSYLAGLIVQVAVTNLADRDPPRTLGTGAIPGINYDVANANPLGRQLGISFLKRWTSL